MEGLLNKYWAYLQRSIYRLLASFTVMFDVSEESKKQLLFFIKTCINSDKTVLGRYLAGIPFSKNKTIILLRVSLLYSDKSTCFPSVR